MLDEEVKDANLTSEKRDQLASSRKDQPYAPHLGVLQLVAEGCDNLIRDQVAAATGEGGCQGCRGGNDGLVAAGRTPLAGTAA